MDASHPQVVTPELLDALRSQPDLPDDVWYLVVVVALCVLNRPEDIPVVYAHAVARRQLADEEHELAIARRIREALLKTSAIGGMPKVCLYIRQSSRIVDSSTVSLITLSRTRTALAYLAHARTQTINALQELKRVVPAHLLDEPHGESPTGRRQDVYATSTATVLARGQEFFDKCYGKVAGRVMTSLDHSGTEDLGLAVRLTYGYVLSTTDVLSETETSFVMIAGLIPQDVSTACNLGPTVVVVGANPNFQRGSDEVCRRARQRLMRCREIQVNPQLKGHLRGALNGGASAGQVRAVRRVAIHVCEAAGMRVLTERDVPGGWVWRTEVQDL